MGRHRHPPFAYVDYPLYLFEEGSLTTAAMLELLTNPTILVPALIFRGLAGNFVP